MNKIRRKEIYHIINKLNQVLTDLQLKDIDDILILIEELVEAIEFIFEEEEECRDNTPENLQNGNRYLNSEIACEFLEEAINSFDCIDENSNLDDIVDSINDAINCLNNSIV